MLKTFLRIPILLFPLAVLAAWPGETRADLGTGDDNAPSPEEAINKPPVVEFKGITGESTLNVVLSNRGGYGDVVSGLVMVDQFRLRYPGIKINVIYSDPLARERTANGITPKIAELRDGFVRSRGVQENGGVLFWNSELVKELPYADALLSFSVDPRHFDYHGNYSKTAPVRILLSEFGDYKYWTGQLPDDRVHLPPPVDPQVERHLDGPRIHLNTGMRNTGLYISRERPQADYPRGVVIDQLKRLRGAVIQHPDLVSDVAGGADARLAFSYASTPEAAAEYLEAMRIHAGRNPGTRFVLGLSGAVPAIRAERLPANLQVIAAPKMPYSLAREAVAASDLPVLVTGDGSLNLAVDFEKPFVYELRAWKAQHAREMLLRLRMTRAMAGSRSSQERMLRAIPTVGRPSENEARFPRAADIAAMFEDERFQGEFKAALAETRSENVLADNLDKVFGFLARNPRPTQLQLETFMGAVSKTCLKRTLEILGGIGGLTR